jgi:DNA-directed RNA polymerase specialized sigma24 family protein
MIDQGYFAKDLDTFALRRTELLREQSRDRNRKDSGGSEEDQADFQIAKDQAKFAMADRPHGMNYDDLLEVGTHVIMYNRHADGSKYRGKDLADAIARKIVRKKKQWRTRNKVRADEGDADSAWEPEKWAQRKGEQGFAPVFAPRPRRAEVDPPDPLERWKKLDLILASLSRVQQQIVALVLCGEKQTEAARIAGVSQSTVSDLFAKLKHPHRNLR